jgi:sugar lactone lactonase YvrE
VPEWRFVQELRIGSENDDPTGFSDVRGILVDHQGNIWVLEFSTQEIRIFDLSGHHVRNIGRKGQGPGEFVYPDGMALAPDGLVWVHDPQNGRFSIFSQEGKFVRQQLAVSRGYGHVWRGGIDTKGRIWDALIENSPDARMRRASGDWKQVDTLSLPVCRLASASPEAAVIKLPRGGMTLPYYPGPVTAVDYSSGTMWCAPTSAEYRVFRVGMEKPDTLARISVRAEPVPVTSQERDSVIAGVKEFMKRAGEASVDWSRIPKYKPLLVGAFVDSDGRLWLQRENSAARSVLDVFSPLGKPLGTVRFPFPVQTYLKPQIHGNTAYLVSQQPGEVPYVIRGHFLIPNQ